MAWKIYLVKKNEKEFENKKDEIKQNVIDQLKKRGLYQLIEDVEPYLARNYENYQALHHDMYNGLHAGMLTKIKEFRSQLAEFDKQIAGLRDDREKLHNNRGELEQYQLKLIEMLNKFEFNSFCHVQALFWKQLLY
ncbi:MAG: hypothetical protein HWD59_05715 [Coxiellaceae bacterium]|nr:MAG: hypothetical protein HWD59_05715 [Coxiellaceae bacterium]